jgi:hypothetical protein
MESKIGRIALGVVALAAAVVLLVVLSGGEDSGSGGDGPKQAAGRGSSQGGGNSRPVEGGARQASLPTIVVRGGKPVGGVRELDYAAGEEIRFAVRSETPDELHVHGYDVERPLPAGRTVRIGFEASIEGIFEAELHGSGEQIAELRIEP